jgi:hypothetical protein
MTTLTQLLYEKDFHAWLDHHVNLLKQKKFNELDLDILIDELESMAKRDRREIVNRLIVLIAHLLKWQFQYQDLSEMLSNWRASSWRGTIHEQRIKIHKQLKETPSLKRLFDEAIQEAYPDALELAAKETNLPMKTFPKTCPYSQEQLLDNSFFPTI